MTDLTVEERVANGAQFLDVVAPGWEWRIDIATLKLSDEWNCICGQVFAEPGNDFSGSGFDYAFDVVIPKSLTTEGLVWVATLNKYASTDNIDVSELGFDLSQNVDDVWSALEDEWKKVIQNRRMSVDKGSDS